jgi:hypothetical protein
MSDRIDRELARRFGELRHSDEGGAPGFRALIDRPPRPPNRARRAILRLALAGALAGAAVLAALLLRGPARAPDVERPVLALGLAEWHSPTDSFLRTPGRDLLERGPAPPAAAPDYTGFERPPTPSNSDTPIPDSPTTKGASS